MTLTRRHTLKALLAAAAAASVPNVSIGAAKASRPVIPWKNWSGTQTCLPLVKATPKGLDELASVIKASTGTVRAVGSGHSYSPLVPTDGTLLSLRRFNGLIEHDTVNGTVKMGAGTKLSQLGPMLEDLGQAMANMPDIDDQTMAGAFSTGTHGTGLALPALHDAVEGLTMVTASGEVLECSRSHNAEVFDAARVSLGALGIITDYTLKNPASYRVERKTWIEKLDSLLERGEQIARDNRNFEFLYIPFSDHSYCFTTNVTDKPITGRPVDDEVDSVEQMKMARDILSFNTTIRRMTSNIILKHVDVPPTYVDLPWKTLASDRVTPLFEMEYQLPLESGPKAMREIVDYIESNHPELFMPLEYRYVDADNAWMSAFYGRKSVSISVHRYREGDDPWKVFSTVRDICRKYEGRPHWGKIHDYTYQDLKPIYPKIDEFKKVRRALDPEGRFLNNHLKELLGLNA
jgi:FAD-linked oxidoreductase